MNKHFITVSLPGIHALLALNNMSQTREAGRPRGLRDYTMWFCKSYQEALIVGFVLWRVSIKINLMQT